jgi:hypothetical protein
MTNVQLEDNTWQGHARRGPPSTQAKTDKKG